MRFISKVIVLSSLAQIVFASWPVFVAPDITFLRSNSYLDESDCPAGQAKVKPNIILNVQKNFCRSFCPANWYWIIDSDNTCHDYNAPINQNVSIDHILDSDGNTSYSVVTASYHYSTDEYFRFTMTTAPGEYWHCYLMNAELNLVTCANDI